MEKADFWRNFKIGFIRGIGGAVGTTIGFGIVSTIVIFVLNKIIGLTQVGKWISNFYQYIQ